MAASRYLFVVKDSNSKSFSKSDEAESQSIQRHVQINSILQKQSSRQPTDKDNGLQLAFVEVKPKAGSPKCAEIRSKGISGASSRQLMKTRLPRRCSVTTRKSPSIHGIPCMPAHEEHVIDPFASTGVSIDRQAHSLLQYFIQVSHPRTWHSEVQKDRSYTFARDARTLVRESFEHEVHFDTLLASMASQMQHFDQVSQDKSFADVLATKAITTVRRYLKTSPPIVQRLIFDIHQMGVTAFYRYELESAHMHLTAVKALLPQVGGIEGIDPSLREWIVIGDGYVAAELSTKPLFPASCFDPGDYILYKQSNITAESSPGQFLQDQKNWKLFPIKMRDILLDMVEAVQVYKQQFSIPPSDAKATDKNTAFLHWLLLRTTALRHRLLELEIEDDRVNVIRIALIEWLFWVMTVTGRQRTCKVLSTKLKSALCGTLAKGSWAEHEDILLWVLLTGAICASAVDRAWFLSAVQELQRPTGMTSRVMRSSQSLATFCERFFYIENIQGDTLRACFSLTDR